MTRNASPEIVVFGSCMIDLICYTPRLPKPGETLHGNEFKLGNGGKGANQCVAAAKLGGSTALIARVGNDSFGTSYKQNLQSLGVNTDHVLLTENISSGMAQITVSDEGENVIVIVAGANSKLSVDDAQNALDLLLNSKVVIFQFEAPLTSTIGVLQLIKRNEGGPCTIINGAPALKDVDPILFSLCDIFCVNETEAEEITGLKVTSIKDCELAISKIQSLGCLSVIITMGKDGALFSQRSGEVEHISAPAVTPVDTTGAGDAFIGALAYFSAYHPDLSLHKRISKACSIASISVQGKGTQNSFPYKKDIPENIFTDI